MITAFRAFAIPPDPITAVGFILVFVLAISGLLFKLACMAYDRWTRRARGRDSGAKP